MASLQLLWTSTETSFHWSMNQDQQENGKNGKMGKRQSDLQKSFSLTIDVKEIIQKWMTCLVIGFK